MNTDTKIQKMADELGVGWYDNTDEDNRDEAGRHFVYFNCKYRYFNTKKEVVAWMKLELIRRSHIRANIMGALNTSLNQEVITEGRPE